MALGTYDANGIWHYGESDNIALFSDTLNKLSDSASSAITADRARLATLEAGSLSGLIPIKPTTATFVTGTGAVNSIGTITFTGCSSFSINGVFTSAYKNYKIVLYATKSGASTGNNTFMLLRTGSTNSTTTYTAGYTGWYAGGTTIFSTPDSASFPMTQNYYPVAYSLNVDVFSPAETRNTSFQGLGRGTNSAAECYFINGGVHETATSYDGVTIGISGGLFTGQAVIYGWND